MNSKQRRQVRRAFIRLSGTTSPKAQVSSKVRLRVLPILDILLDTDPNAGKRQRRALQQYRIPVGYINVYAEFRKLLGWRRGHCKSANTQNLQRGCTQVFPERIGTPEILVTSVTVSGRTVFPSGEHQHTIEFFPDKERYLEAWFGVETSTKLDPHLETASGLKSPL